MLPLWIIDLTQGSDRREAFTKLLGRVKGVLTYEDGAIKQLEATNDFYKSYEDEEKSRECIWFYSHIKSPFSDKDSEGNPVDLNAPYAPSDKDNADVMAYIKAILEAEQKADEKIKAIEEKETVYRKEMLDIFYRDFQEVAVKEGQSFMDLLSSSMTEAKAKAIASKGESFDKDIVNSLCEDFERKLEAEGESFNRLINQATEEAEQKASVNAKAIADAKAKVLEERQLESHRAKYKALYDTFKKRVQKETKDFRERLAAASGVAEKKAGEYEIVANDESEIIRKDVFESLYHDFQGSVVAAGRVFMDLLLESMSNSEVQVLEEAKAKMFEDKEIAYHKSIAEKLYKNFQEVVVKEGQRFVELVRRTRGHAYSTFNICVVGDSTEEFTRLVFPSVAVMLQKEKGRILPTHIHQGVSILGALFVPSDINAKYVGIRNKIRLTLDEIDVQHNISTVHGYDRMLYYQDVQNRTENFYPLLSVESQAEYLLQCLINLYYACSEVHPLLSGNTSDDSFYFAMGPSAVYYDSLVQDEKDKKTVADNLMVEFLKDGDMEKPDVAAPWFTAQNFLRGMQEAASDDFAENDDGEVVKKKQLGCSPVLDLGPSLEPNSIIECFRDFNISITQIRDPEIHVDPIEHFHDKMLKRSYFMDELKYYPAEMKFLINDYVEGSSREILERCGKTRKKLTENFANNALPLAIREMLRTCDHNTGGLKRIETNVDNLKTNIGKIEENIDRLIERKLWFESIIQDPQKVPRKLKDFFIAYHDAYNQDLKSKSSEATFRESQWKSAMDAFKRNLGGETPMLSRFARNFLQSLVTAIAVIPFLKMVSNSFFDIGNIYSHTAILVTIIFMIPVLIQVLTLWVYYWNRKNCKNRLKAMILHDAYARVVNKAYSEICKFYEDAKELCDKYLKRCEDIRRDVRSQDFEESGLELPKTRFCQPLTGGKFCGRMIMGENEVEPGIMRIQHMIKRPIHELDREDFFSMICGYNDSMNMLMLGVHLDDALTHYFDKDKQREVFESKEVQRENDKKFWAQNIKDFKAHLDADIQKDLLPRECPTVGEKVMAYYNKYLDDKRKQISLMLKPLIDFSASNGEFTTAADPEYADVKTNVQNVYDLAKDLLPVNKFELQLDTADNLYKRYLFVTRWRTYDFIRLNRVLPLEDFDDESRSLLVSEKNNVEKEEHSRPSSLFLLAISQTGEARDTEWLRLFPDRVPSNLVWSDMKAYQDILNVDD